MPCKRCNLYKTAQNPEIPSAYPDGANVKIAFIGEAPGQQEEEQGEPFVGPAGDNLNRALSLAQVNRGDVFIGNVCRCRPPNNRTPQRKEMSACLPHLIADLKRVKPKVVVCLGLTAAKAILRTANLTMGKNHGRFFNGKPFLGFDCTITVTWHPSPKTFENNDHRKAEMFSDIRSAVQKISDDPVTTKKTWTDVIVTSLESWKHVEDILHKSSFIVWDLECTGLDEHADDAAITNVGLCCDKRFGVSVICEKDLWSNPDDLEEVMKSIDRMMANKDIKKIAHNMKFDSKYYYAMRGVWPQNWYWDTALGHAVLVPRSSNKLKDLAWTYTNHGGYEDVLLAFGGLLEAGALERAEYNIYDCMCTLEIASTQFTRLENDDPERFKLFNEVIMPSAELLAGMEFGGVRVDLYKIDELEETYTQRIKAMERKIYTHGTVLQFTKVMGAFNPNSKEQLRTILFDKKFCGFKSIKVTSSGKKPAVDKEVLTILKDGGSNLCEYLLEHSALTKLQSTYITGMRKNIVDGKIHTNYNQDVAVSGRLSSSRPNLQNIPKVSDIKSIFIADHNHILLEADYSQMELAVSTYYTHDPVMIEALTKPVPGLTEIDAHKYIAMKLFGISLDQVEERRRYVKAINFGVLYGMGAEKLAGQLKIKAVDAKKLIAEYFKLFKPTHDWIQQIRQNARSGEVRSLFGRIRRYSPDKPEEYNSAVNHPIQSLASDLMLTGMIRWKKYLETNGLDETKARMVLQVHDSICTSVHKDLINKLAKAKKHTLESVKFDFMTVPLSVDISIGKSWGDIQDVKWFRPADEDVRRLVI